MRHVRHLKIDYIRRLKNALHNTRTVDSSQATVTCLNNFEKIPFSHLISKNKPQLKNKKSCIPLSILVKLPLDRGFLWWFCLCGNRSHTSESISLNTWPWIPLVKNLFPPLPLSLSPAPGRRPSWRELVGSAGEKRTVMPVKSTAKQAKLTANWRFSHPSYG